MAFLLTVLRVLGILLLIVFVMCNIMVLLIIFVPFRYYLTGSVNDPEGSSEILHLQLKRDVAFKGEMRWLFGGVRVRAIYDGQKSLDVHVFGIPVPAEKLLEIAGKRRERKRKEEPPAPKEVPGLEERIERILCRIEKTSARIDDALYVLGTDYGERARHTLYIRLVPLIEGMLPSKWGLTGVLGLGDPARSAKIYSAQGFLYPVIAGHVAIDAEYDLYRYDLQGAAQGGVQFCRVLYAWFRIILDRDVRHMLKRLLHRKGPSGHRGPKGAGSRTG